MRGKGSWKRLLCVVLALALVAVMPVSALSEEVHPKEEKRHEREWVYEDSLLVEVIVDEAKVFTSEDFPGIDCKKIFVRKKVRTEQGGFLYQLILQMNKSGDEALREALETVSQLPMVVRAERDEEHHYGLDSFLQLNHSYLYLPVGNTADIFITDINLYAQNYYRINGIYFAFDTKKFNVDTLEKDSFSEYGISHFWPGEIGDESLLIPGFEYKLKESEGQKSEKGIYYGLAGEDNEYLYEAMEKLAACPEILEVRPIVEWAVGCPPPPYFCEEWRVAETDIAECILTGGEQSPDYETRINQTATVCGRKPGVTNITCRRVLQLAEAENKCTLIVYEPGSKNNPGDVDHDGSLSAGDALFILKHTVGKNVLEKNDRQAADLNHNGRVDAMDALLILKIVVGIL